MTAPRLLIVLCCGLVSAGCVSHTRKLAQVKVDIAMPGYAVDTNAVPFRAKDVEGRDKILFLAERARAYQLTGDLERSSTDYIAAEAAYDALDDRPVVSISTTAEKGIKGTLANDTALPYEGNAHERLMLYQLDAFNHLARLDWNNTRAAANNIIYLSEKERARRDKEVAVAEEAAKKDGRFSLAALRKDANFTTAFSESDKLSKTFVDAMQNGYAYYFGAFVSEVDGDPSKALIGYRRAAEVAPANKFVKRDIARMEAELDNSIETPAVQPNVVVFFEEGFAPELTAFTMAFTTLPVKDRHDNAIIGGGAVGGKPGIASAVPIHTSLPLSVKFTFPYYSGEQLNAVHPLPLVVSDGGNGVVAETELVGDFRALAARAFSDRFPYIATRAAFRSIAKATAAAVANAAVKDRSTMTRLAVFAGGMLLTQATEFADLRTWLLAPRFGQIARFRLDPGEHKLTLAHAGNSKTVQAQVPDGGTLVLHVISIPGKLIVEGTGLDFE